MALGSLTGFYLAPFVTEFGYFFGIALIAVIGLKFAIESYRFIPEEKVILIDSYKTLTLLTIAGSTNTFFAGFGLGLAGSGFLLPVILTMIFVFCFSLTGKIFGQKKSLQPRIRFIGIYSGILIVAFSLRLMILYFI